MQEVPDTYYQLGRVRRSGWQRQSHGLHVPLDQVSFADQLRAWSAVLPGSAAFSHLTAAALRGWCLPHPITPPIFVALPAGEPRPRRTGVLVCRHSQETLSVLAHGLRVATAAETLLATCRDLGILDLVVLGDHALRVGHCTVEQLSTAAAERRRGARRLRMVIPLLDRRSESPWESVMRILHYAASVPVEPQYEVFDEDGRFVARADLHIRGTRRVHEYDGAVHREASVHEHDLGRGAKLVEAGWERVGFTSRHLLTQGASIIASTDRLFGRSWDPRRLGAWNGLLAESVCTAAGRDRSEQRWARAYAPR